MTGASSLGGQALAGLKPHRRARLGLARTFQLPQPFTSLSVLENVRVPLLFGRAAGRAAATARAHGMPGAGGAGGQGGMPPRELTQVEQRRLELARAIALEPAAADRRRGDGRAVATPRWTRSSACCSALNAAGTRSS